MFIKGIINLLLTVSVLAQTSQNGHNEEKAITVEGGDQEFFK